MTDADILIEDCPTTVANKVIKTVHISGQLDESNVDEKIQAIYKIFEKTPKGLNLIFDLEKLEYMNSKSIGYLTDIYGKVSESGGAMAITKAKPNITDILQVVGLTQLIKTFETMDEAKQYIESTGGIATATATITDTITAPVTTPPTPPNPIPAPTPAPTPTPIPTPTPTPVPNTTLTV